MAFLGQLQGQRKLRSAATNDRSQPLTAPPADAAAAAALLHSRVRGVDIDEWLDALAALSPASQVLPMTEAEGAALQVAFAVKCGRQAALSDEESACLARVEHRLHEALQAYGGTGFVKLSSRSPKDATLAEQRLIDEACALLESAAWRAELGFAADDDSTNVRVAALLQASIESMHVRSGAEALALLCGSERVHEDVQLERDAAHTRGGAFRMSFVVREFVPMQAHLEFRAFVHGGRLSAISQYNHICCYPNLVAAREAVQAALVEFFASSVAPLAASLPPNYVIDFALLGARLCSAGLAADAPGRPIVIELNPYADYEGNGTDACLYDWRADRAAIEAEATSMRVRVEPLAGLAARMAADGAAMLRRVADAADARRRAV